MNILIKREIFTDESTIGKLYIDGVYECYTLEDVVREEKIEGKTAIPYGKYTVIIDFSERLKKELPHILNVPGFQGVRIHRGNVAEDTEGCILLGTSITQDRIWNSQVAFGPFFDKLENAYQKNEPITIEIT